ncbi:MAG: glycosyltransferase [bacterium]
MTDSQITFYLGRIPDPDRVLLLDPVRDWDVFGTGVYAWIVLTYIRLRDAGYPVRCSASVPDQGIVVLHPRQIASFLREEPALHRLVIVVARADKAPQPLADFEIVQNRASSDGRRHFHVPHWPQPGLIARDPARGARVETVCFKGVQTNLHPEFRSEAWPTELARRGVRFRMDSIRYPQPEEVSGAKPWPDFAEVDVQLAIRPISRDLLRKPASKLQNSWLAGVPGIFGPEPAYRDLRRSPLDYLEVRSAAEALEALDRLRADPMLFRAMVENGTERAIEVSWERTTERWAELLFDTVPSLSRSTSSRLRRRLPFTGRRVVHHLRASRVEGL